MYKFSDSRVISFSAQQLFDLVLDVESYDNFVPWCSKCTILEKRVDTIIADMYIKSGFIKNSYRSIINHGFDDGVFYINVTQASGPFKSLVTNWKFCDIAVGKARVEFNIEFSFETEMLNKIVGFIFSSTSSKMIEAFENRARKIYGKTN